MAAAPPISEPAMHAAASRREKDSNQNAASTKNDATGRGNSVVPVMT